MELFRIGFISFTIVDLADILIFTFVFYKLYSVVKDSRATTMFLGMLSVVVIGIFAEFLNLTIMSWIINSLRTIFWLGFFILFQPELRRILTHIGQNRVLNRLLQIKTQTIFDEVSKAAFMLSEKRIGGLIVLSKNVGIKSVIESGIQIKSDVSPELLATIFNPASPLHDGAVVVSNDQIVAAKCILPASTKDIGPQFGTRHRAAVGLSEESDAIIVIVSEETGEVRIAYDGDLLRIDNADDLKKRMEKLFSYDRSRTEE
ncbi:MAG TPA: diadenylate cyclase CdaA [Clostridiales bacterium]|nr:diadenylate cyclase CdaA [Clostridiales bacterium]HQP68778.1 diadenylate cyclase CdaA [Clostridiales bacterium]